MSSYFCKRRSAATAEADERLLARLGYKQEFRREFTPFEVFGLAFSAVGVFPGIANFLSIPIYYGGPVTVAIVWGWTVASLFIILVSMTMAELASAAPTSGGLYFWTYSYSYSSPKWRNPLTWIVGHSNTVGCIASVATIDWVVAVQILAAVDISTNEPYYIPTIQKTFGIYAAVVISQAVVCSLGTRILARLQNIYAVLNVILCLVVIVALPAATPKELKNDARYALLGKNTSPSSWPSGFAFILSFLAPIFTMVMFDTSVHISEESLNAATAVPWAIVLSTSIAAILGFAVNVAIVFCMGPALIGGGPVPPLANILLNSFGQQATLAIWSFVILTQYTIGSSMMLAASRQSFAFARDKALPFSNWLYRMNSFTKTPVNAVWFVAAGSIALGALALAGPQAVGVVASISSAAQYVAYIIPITARWIWRKENAWKPGPFSLGAWSGIFAVISIIWMVFTLILCLFPITKQTNARDMNYTVVVLGAVFIFSLVSYYFPVYGGMHWFEGPVSNVDGYVVERGPNVPRGVEGVIDDIVIEKSDGDIEINSNSKLVLSR